MFEEDTKSKILFLGVVLCLVVALTYSGTSNDKKTGVSPTLSVNQSRKYSHATEVLNLGMTLDSFKKAYNHKAMENELLSLSLDNVTIEEKDDKSGVLCYFGDVVMMIDVDKSSGLVTQISVASEPFTNANRTKKTQIMLLQSVVWGLSSMVFNQVMENQQYRESALRRILSNPNTDYMISGNIKIAAIRIDNFLIITIEPKD